MARRSYIAKKRREAERRYADLVEGPATRATKAAVPELLARAVALVEAHPDAAFWAGGLHTVVGSFRLCRLFRPALIASGNVDLVVLYNPDVVTPAFPVATLVGTQYRAMTDVKSFEQWLKLQGVP